MAEPVSGVQLVGSGPKWKAEERKSERKEEERGRCEESYFLSSYPLPLTSFCSLYFPLRHPHYLTPGTAGGYYSSHVH